MPSLRSQHGPRRGKIGRPDGWLSAQTNPNLVILHILSICKAILSEPLQSFAHYVVLLNIIADLPILADNDLNRLQ